METLSTIIEKKLIDVGKKKSDLARYMDISPQALRYRLSTQKFSYSELQTIADFFGCDLVLYFSDEQNIQPTTIASEQVEAQAKLYR